jgi:ABC-type glycerol-3-phosphate transport system substrate-binding protein
LKGEGEMTKKEYLIVFMALSLMLFACGPAATPEVTEAPPPTSPPTKEAPPQPTDTEVPPTEEPEPVTIAFWYPYGEGSWTGDFLAGKIVEFNEANPDITVVGQSYEDYASIIEGLQRAAAGENLPGIATIAYGYDQYIVNSGLTVTLEDYLGEEGEAFLDDFFPSLIEVTTFDGKVYGVPLALSVAEIFYHSDLFEQAGLDPNNPPSTWEEFLAAARTINEELGIFGATFALDDPWIFETAVRSNGGDFLSADGKTATLDSDVAVATLSDWAAGVMDGSILYNADFFETLQTFGAGQVAMFAVSSYGTLYYKEVLPLAMAMQWPAGEGFTIKSPAGGNSLYVFGNNDREREAAAKFVVYLNNPDANAEWAMNSGYLPTRASSLEKLADFIEGFDNYQVAVSEIEFVVPPVQFPGGEDLQIRQHIMEAIEAALLGASDAATALTDANAKINDLIGQ